MKQSILGFDERLRLEPSMCFVLPPDVAAGHGDGDCFHC
jgi:hypothetical protein